MPLRVLSTLGLAAPLRELGPRFEQQHGITLDAEFQPTALLMARIREGERADAAILTREAVDELIQAGVLRPGSRRDLARSAVGVAVREGAPRPDISTPDAFVATLLAARSVALSKAGASGIFMAGLLAKLGIADQVDAKATVIPSGFTGELVSRGEADLAIQQVSELMAVPGITVLGTLPPEIAGITVFTAGVFTDASEADAGAALLAYLASPVAAPVLRGKGLEPFCP